MMQRVEREEKERKGKRTSCMKRKENERMKGLNIRLTKTYLHDFQHEPSASKKMHETFTNSWQNCPLHE